ncbi:MAG: DUF2635 domain-containing protein, partial [Proteobacteria bacterium]|nr:DUF2635 domain-containing protein [Pseudomonadota bacterium]
MPTMYVVPAEGRQVRDPRDGQPIPAEGKEVTDSPF